MADAVLEIHDLNAHYGTSHVLQDVSFVVDGRPVAVIGRNGMGKSTMCAAIMGMRNALSVLKQSIEEERVIERPELAVSFAEINDLMGLGTIREMEKRFLTAQQLEAKYGQRD